MTPPTTMQREAMRRSGAMTNVETLLNDPDTAGVWSLDRRPLHGRLQASRTSGA